MVEHTAVNRGVVGSSPTRGASEERDLPAELPAGFLYQENHAIVAWFYRSFSDVFRQKNS